MDRKIRSLPGPHLAWQIRPRRGAKTHLDSRGYQSATLIGSPDKVDSTIARGLAIVPGGRQQSGRVNAAEYFLIEDISKGGRVVKLNVRDRDRFQEAGAICCFRKLVERSGIKKEMRRKEYYEKPSETRRLRHVSVPSARMRRTCSGRPPSAL